MKNENKITIVTAFFSLKRGEWEGFERDNKKYFEWFEFWSRIQNDLIIYTDPASKKYIEEIRIKKHGRNNTKIIVIDDYTSIDSNLYLSIKKATETDFNKKLHLYEKNPESWNANYNYVMLLKEWCINDALQKNIIKDSDMIAWVDFGFNHGGEYYLDPNDFNFEWKWNFSNKVHLFYVNEPDDTPIFEIVKLMSTYIQGDIIVAPGNLWKNLWNSVRNNMIAMNKMGFVDDDQIFLLMYYRDEPENCELHKSNWFSEIEDCSNKKFKVKQKKIEKTSKIQKIIQKIKKRKLAYSYNKKWYKIMCKEETKY